MALIQTALQWGLELVITDVDALVLREPFAYMARWPDASFLTTSDHLGNTSGSRDGGLEDHGATSSAFNIGYMYFNTSARPLVRAWRDMMCAVARPDLKRATAVATVFCQMSAIRCLLSDVCCQLSAGCWLPPAPSCLLPPAPSCLLPPAPSCLLLPSAAAAPTTARSCRLLRPHSVT